VATASSNSSYLYLSVGAQQGESGRQQSLQVFDVRDPANPSQVANVPIDLFGKLELEGSDLYILTERREDRLQDYLQVWDVSDPAQPTQMGETLLRDRPSRLQVFDGLGFAATRTGLAVYDLRDPAAPREVAFRGTPAGGSTGSVARYGPWVYNVDSSNGLMIMRLNVADSCAS
jgi:hypothetical protein